MASIQSLRFSSRKVIKTFTTARFTRLQSTMNSSQVGAALNNKPPRSQADDPATQNQLDFASRLAKSSHVDESKLEGLQTKGEVSDFITQASSAANFNPIKEPQGAVRDEPMSNKQRELVERLARRDGESPGEMTKGEASDFIQSHSSGANVSTVHPGDSTGSDPRAVANEAHINPIKVPVGEDRNSPATKAQIDFAQRLLGSGRVAEPEVPLESMTKGQISDFITDAAKDANEAPIGVNPIKIPKGETRNEPASQKQVEFAERLKGNSNVVKGDIGESKGEVSDFIQESIKSTKNAV